MNTIGVSPLSSPTDQIEPIRYEDIKVNPPKWVEETRRYSKKKSKEKVVISEGNIAPSSKSYALPQNLDAITRTEKIALYTISGIMVIAGISLFAAAFVATLPISGTILLCGLGLTFAFIGAVWFESTYNKQTLEHEKQTQEPTVKL